MDVPRFDSDIEQARRVVGASDAERARWLLTFCRTDVPNLSADKRGEVRLQLRVFAKTVSTFNEQQLKQAWKQVRRQVHGVLMEGKQWKVPMRATGILTLSDGALSGEIVPEPILTDHDELLVAAMWTLVQVQKDLGICANEKCREPFIKVGRQRYCTQRCQTTVTKRAYRTRWRARANGQL